MSGHRSQTSRLTEAQLVDWLRLIRSENIGPRTFRELVSRYGGASAALEALPELLARKLRGREIKIASRDDALREIEASRAQGVRFIAISDLDYPATLREIDSAPPLLALRGDATALSRPLVAIVGARNASASGLSFAEQLARDLTREDYGIVSGLARGIDTAAHRASLKGGAVTVLAGGHARPYPTENLGLLDEIVGAGGAAVSEMPLQWEPRGRDFPRRNRIVSGLAQGVVVVEAARRSGSLITARFAAEQGREVFAVPGSPQDPRAEGTNDLLREGATLCAEVEDVTRVLAARVARSPAHADLFSESAPSDEAEPLIDELDLFPFSIRDASPEPEPSAPAPQPARVEPTFIAPAPKAPKAEAIDIEDAKARVLALLSPAPVSLDQLIRAVGLPARDVQGALVDLDLEGRIERHGAALVSLIARK
ncbi:DNA-processing protein DprA [Methylocystis bryophila]|uniref:DNA protecting protein DprA n=1 Tax=Methylocystis bryophila TaxID=655015 RepID=A0A1W6MQL0_9HYPH|nr:DNA-processing protein DprA [Methylocystis bryophila]ARN79883.1 DNA protecting protein DprA [Methylocystis bryophila]BDV39773.1 DNA processing protein DprA [Methylocystis bryophila]